MLNNLFTEAFVNERLPEIREEILDEIEEQIITTYNAYVKSQQLERSVKTFAVYKHQFVQFGNY